MSVSVWESLSVENGVLVASIFGTGLLPLRLLIWGGRKVLAAVWV